MDLKCNAIWSSCIKSTIVSVAKHIGWMELQQREKGWFFKIKEKGLVFSSSRVEWVCTLFSLTFLRWYGCRRVVECNNVWVCRVSSKNILLLWTYTWKRIKWTGRWSSSSSAWWYEDVAAATDDDKCWYIYMNRKKSSLSPSPSLQFLLYYLCKKKKCSSSLKKFARGLRRRVDREVI